MTWLDNHPKKAVVLITIFLFFLSDSLLAYFLNQKLNRNTSDYYHHDLKPSGHIVAKWGANIYNLNTNSLGFKDKTARKIDLKKNKYRILFIGDSFTEGLGYEYDQTFVGLIDKHLSKIYGYEVFNAAVTSYSPKIYYLKIKYLLENVGFYFDELIVFIDISDIQDEIIYKNYTPKKIPLLKKIDLFLKNHSYSYNKSRRLFLNREKLRIFFNEDKSSENETKQKDFSAEYNQFYYQERGKWSNDNDIYEKWGKEGLTLAEKNMEKLYDLCQRNNIKVTIAVYPWPEQIRNKEINSKQVTFWGDFSDEKKISFINFFPDFINSEEPEIVINRYFIERDDHWKLDGHKKIASSFLEYKVFER
jgi:hypothetical protein